MKKTVINVFGILLIMLLFNQCDQKPASIIRQMIHGFCIDFNWGDGGPNAFAAPGLWADADPEEHIKWYKDLGANVIQTFCVSCNGYAWYKNGRVPPQPGLKHDFLPEMVKRGHKEGMKVMGYFCIGSNTRWGLEHPDLSYGIPNDCHIPYTDQYLAYLDTAIRDAVKRTGIDGFMIDWIWQPNRSATGGKWIESEKKLFEELMGKPFPGETQLSDQEYLAYSRKAIDRCWSVIHKAAKETNPDCIIWLSCYNPTHPHVINSTMFREIDWLMNENGDTGKLDTIQSMIGSQTRLITCLAQWNKQNALTVIPDALQKGIGLYGFTKPGKNSLPPPIDQYLKVSIDSLQGDNKNIAALARAFHGYSPDYVER